jgi:uncharacterized protein (TIGR03435 family)
MRTMTFQAAPTAYLARSLSMELKKKVVDETNLQGAFDCKLEWTPDMDRSAPPSDPGGPSIFTAIREQLGLRLHMEKAAVDVYVIDGVEKPSEN